jgi:glucose-6-phosphate dehydrogenase assembly protein OpcA
MADALTPGPDPVELDRWSGRGVQVSEVVAELGELHDEPTRQHYAARTAVMTMVAVANRDDEADVAMQALRSLAGHHPSRIVLVRPDPDSVAHMDARAALYAYDHDVHRVCFEEVQLDVGGQAAFHLDSVVEAFTLSDLPVVVWYVNSIPDASDPLLSVASAILIDSRDAPDTAQLRSLLALARRRTLVDLSWSRLRPWREILAGLFDPPANRTWLDHLQRVEIAGKEGPRRLLGGWVVAQTGVSPRRVTLEDARHVSIRLVAEREGRTGTFSAERDDTQRAVAGEAIVPDAPPVLSSTLLPDDQLASSLSFALTHLRPDPVWETALSTAAAVSD